MRSVEITFDRESDALIRREWEALTDARLPSLALHTAASNRPHLTLVAGDELAPLPLDPEDIAAIPAVIDLAGLMVFPTARDRWILVHGAVVSQPLARLQERVARRFPGGVSTTQPGAWVPHVTLARRLTGEGVGRALHALAEVGVREQHAIGVAAIRFWDGDTRTVSVLWPGSAAEDPLTER